MNLHTRFLVTIVSLIIIPTVFLGIILGKSFERVLLQRTASDIQVSANLMNHRISDYYDRNIERLNGITSRTQLRLSLQKYLTDGNVAHLDKVRKIILDAKQSINEILAIHILDYSGRIVASTNKERENVVYDKPGILAKASKNDYFNAYREDGLSKLVLAGRLILGVETLGFAVVDLNDRFLDHIVNSDLGFNSSEEIIIAKKNDEGDIDVLFSKEIGALVSSKDLTIKKDAQLPIVAAVLKNISDNGQKIDYKGSQVLSSSAYVENFDWGFVVQVKRDVLFAASKQVYKVALIFMFISILCAVFMSFIMSKSIVLPILQLKKHAKNIIDGNFLQAPESYLNKFDDEIGDLARSLDQVTASLFEGNKLLDDKVKERTEELEKRIHELDNLNQLMVGRELKMVELKNTIKNLKKELDNEES